MRLAWSHVRTARGAGWARSRLPRRPSGGGRRSGETGFALPRRIGACAAAGGPGRRAAVLPAPGAPGASRPGGGGRTARRPRRRRPPRATRPRRRWTKAAPRGGRPRAGASHGPGGPHDALEPEALPQVGHRGRHGGLRPTRGSGRRADRPHAIAAPRLLGAGSDGHRWDGASATAQEASDILPDAQLFTDTLVIPEEEYATRWAPSADAVARAPGVGRETWIADVDPRTFASVDVWDTKASADRFIRTYSPEQEEPIPA